MGAGTTRRGLTVSVGQSYASSQKGISAFQRGKYEDALKHLEPAAEKGDPEALYYLGRMYGAGQGVPRDQNKATAFFKKAAEGGSPGAQQSLGSALMLGEGIETDMIEALKWFIVSARVRQQGRRRLCRARLALHDARPAKGSAQESTGLAKGARGKETRIELTAGFFPSARKRSIRRPWPSSR